MPTSRPAHRTPLPPISPAPASSRETRRADPDLATMAATVGVIAVGVALVEAALIPGMAIGAAAILAPKLAAKGLPRLRRSLKSLFAPPPGSTRQPKAAALALIPQLGVKQALIKTVTFRVIVTTIDFTVNYIVIGDVATAAGLSAFSLAIGPLFYFLHETAWNYYGANAARAAGLPENANLSFRISLSRLGGVSISRALAKTIVFQVVGTTMDFTTNYVVVRDLATAAILTAPRLVLGPFVYLGHEKLWDYLGPLGDDGGAAVLQRFLPAPA